MRTCFAVILNEDGFSGAAVQARCLARHLQPNNVDFINFVFSSKKKKIIIKGKNFYLKRGFVSYLIQFIPLYFRLLKYLSKKNFDVIQIYGFYPVVIPLICAAKSLNIPIIQKITLFYYPEGDDPITWKRKGLKGYFMLFLLNFVDKIIIQNMVYLDKLKGYKNIINKVEVVSDGIDTNKFCMVSDIEKENIRKKCGYSKSDFIVLFVGKLSKRKGFDLVIETWNDFIQYRTNSKMVVIGPSLKEKYDLKNKNIHYLGVLNETEMPKYYNISNVFFFPSKGEGLPNALLEAMACGIPCIVSNAYGVESIINNNIDGFILGDNEKEEAIRIFKYLYNRPDVCKDIRSRAREKILSKFSISRISSQYKILYENIIKK